MSLNNNITALTRKISSVPSVREEKKHTLLYLSLLLSVNIADVEHNPGPPTSKYPCQICSHAVTWKQRGVTCDDCQQCCHTDCMHMSTPINMSLNNILWHCVNCGMPIFLFSLFDPLLSTLTTHFRQCKC